jgi:hypothetical protein
MKRDGTVKNVKITELLVTEGLERARRVRPAPATSSPSPASRTS